MCKINMRHYNHIVKHKNPQSNQFIRLTLYHGWTLSKIKKTLPSDIIESYNWTPPDQVLLDLEIDLATRRTQQAFIAG